MNFENYLFNKIYPTPEDKERCRSLYMNALRDTDRYGDPGYNHDYVYLTWKYKNMPGQLITTEEAMRVMEIAEEAAKREDTIIAIAKCNCALSYHGDLDYRCIVFGFPVSWSIEVGYARFPKQGLTEFGGAEWRELRSNLKRTGKSVVNASEVKELLTEWANKGLHHTLMSRGVLPLIDGICNCEAPYCMRIRHRDMLGVDGALLKGHNVARIDPEKCDHCGLCKMRCEFGAVIHYKYSGFTNIDPTRCYGCGVCTLECEKGAIKMVSREQIPAAANMW